jgi:hypothetical protein
MKGWKLLILTAGLTLAGCDPENTETTSESITGLRILAIQAEPASAQPGQTVRLRVLLASPVRHPDDLHITWNTCPHPSLEECAKADDLTPLAVGTNVTLDIPEDIFIGDQFIVWVDATQGGARERGAKGVQILAPSVPVNANPALLGATYAGQKPDVLEIEAGEKVPVRLEVGGMLGEIYENSGERALEEVTVRTFTSGGILADPTGSSASGALEYRAPEEPGDYGSWIVILDGRGGVEWTTQWIRVNKKEEEAGNE